MAAWTPLADLRHHQHGVLSRGQALRGGLQDHDLRRRIRRREWAVVHPGVYVEHTGPLTTHQRHWAAVLAMAPAALSHASALAVAVLCEVVGTRRTTPARVRAALDARGRLARRALLTGVLDDLGTGACSALEQGYLRRVERPHGLPAAGRQVRASGRGNVYRDVEYRPWGLVVELDGRAFHTSVRDRARDLDRDLAVAATWLAGRAGRMRRLFPLRPEMAVLRCQPVTAEHRCQPTSPAS